ncbi:MAG TPA: CvpA family protein, partial [Nakamurella sp.]
MTVVDLVIVLLLVAAAFSGYRQGLITAMLALIGAVIGALVGVKVAPLLADQVTDTAAKVAIGIAVVVVGVGLGELAGQWIGQLLTRQITWRPVIALDHGLGLVGYTIAVLIVAWMVAVPLAAAPYPWLSSAIRSSAVLTGVNEVMPAGALKVSAQLRQLFDDSGFPQILDPLSPAPDTPVDPPDAALADSATAEAVRGSILKIRA